MSEFEIIKEKLKIIAGREIPIYPENVWLDIHKTDNQKVFYAFRGAGTNAIRSYKCENGEWREIEFEEVRWPESIIWQMLLENQKFREPQKLTEEK